MYAAPKIYDNVIVAEPNISMYKVAPIYDEIMVSGEDTAWATDIERRQDRCLSELELLRQRLVKLEVDCSGPVDTENPNKLDLVIGCSVGSPAVYLAAIIARKVNCLIKVFSHSTNRRSVDSNITNKLLRVNNGESNYCGINIIYKETAAPYFMACPGRQVAVSGLSNILRYIARERGYTTLYDEDNLQTAALIDEILAIVDLLEQRIDSSASEIGAILNTLASYLTSSPYLAGNSLTIADIGLCSILTAMDSKMLPNSIRSYLSHTVKNNYEMKVLKAFLDWVPGEALM